MAIAYNEAEIKNTIKDLETLSQSSPGLVKVHDMMEQLVAENKVKADDLHTIHNNLDDAYNYMTECQEHITEVKRLLKL